jgi:DNA polymerase-1
MELLYLTPDKRHWVLDVESDDLLDNATVIWVICVEHVLSDEKYTFTDMEEFRKWIAEDEQRIFVGHNIVAFDLPICNRLARTRVGVKRVVDTMLLSMLYSPKLSGGHSLDSWGGRVNSPKLEHKDFTALTDEMITYCQQDVALTKKVFLKLAARMKQIGFTEQSCELEHLSWHIIQNKQKRSGFPFKYVEAEKLYAELRSREEELRKKIYELWPPKFEVVRTFAKSRKANGDYTKDYLRHLEQYPELRELVDGRYEALDWVEFNLGSPSQRVAKLLELGWEPVKFTKVTEKGGGGNPQVDEDSLIAFAESCGQSEVGALAKWIVINGRANMVRTWMDNYNEKTGAIHGNLWLASTLRYRHDHPNSANIPAVRLNKDGTIQYGESGTWTYESRDLWYSGGSDYSLVGVDAKGIQLRILAHYLNDDAFSEAILSEDPHTANQERMGLPSRALTKTITYATLMGAGDARIASEAKVPLAEAKDAKRKFFEQVPGLRRLVWRLKRELQQTGRITLCDGSRIIVTSDHMVIPYLLQGDESRIMRQAAVFLDEECRRARLDAVKVGDIHDEWQNKVRNEHVEPFKGLALDVFPRAGRVFNYRVPIEGDAKVGRTWAETH